MARAPRNLTVYFKNLAGVVRAVGRCGVRNSELAGPNVVPGSAPPIDSSSAEQGIMTVVVDGMTYDVPITIERPNSLAPPPPPGVTWDSNVSWDNNVNWS